MCVGTNASIKKCKKAYLFLFKKLGSCFAFTRKPGIFCNSINNQDAYLFILIV